MPSLRALVATWNAATHRHRIATFAIAIFLVVESVIAIGYRENDFEWHRNLGRTFLAGAPYAEGGQWYPLGRAMIDTVPAVLNKYVARGLSYTLAIAALVAVVRGWGKLAGPQPGNARADWTAALVTFGLSIGLIQRDLDECGLQILLLFMLTAGALALRGGRLATAGGWLALAATYKSTPILFLPFLLWKRQWRAATWMALVVVALNVAPAMYLGTSTMLYGNRLFLTQTWLISQLPDPTQNGVERAKAQNQSLVAVGARYLMTFDSHHPAYVDHPGYLQFGRHSGESATRIIKVGLMLFAVALAWRCRPTSSDFANSDFANQWAVVCALCTLLAPLCWKQHLVLTLPCLFLSIRAELDPQLRSKWRIATLVFIAVLMMGTGRELIGRDLSHLLSSYKIHALAALMSMGLVLTIRSRSLPLPLPPRSRAMPKPQWLTRRASAKHMAGHAPDSQDERPSSVGRARS